MKLGLLADIHEQVEFLRTALGCFRREQVDQVVVLGDLFEMGEGHFATFDSDTSELVSHLADR